MKRSKAELFRYVDNVAATGDVEKQLVKVCDVTGIFVPVSSELASKRGGYNENMAWKFFYRGNNKNVLTGNVIRYLNNDYHIVNVSDLGRIKIVKLSRVIGTRSVRNVVSVLNY